MGREPGISLIHVFTPSSLYVCIDARLIRCSFTRLCLSTSAYSSDPVPTDVAHARALTLPPRPLQTRLGDGWRSRPRMLATSMSMSAVHTRPLLSHAPPLRPHASPRPLQTRLGAGSALASELEAATAMDSSLSVKPKMVPRFTPHTCCTGATSSPRLR